MKIMHSLRLALMGAAALLTQTAFAQTWQTVDDYQYVIGKRSIVNSLAKDPSGNLYAAGDGVNAAGIYHALAMKSTDGGLTWATIDDYSDPNNSTTGSGPGYDAGIVSDSAGNLYAAGYEPMSGGGGTNLWFVRRSIDAGVTWSTVDSFIRPSVAEPRAMATDPAGNVYVTGSTSAGEIGRAHV